MKRRRTILFIGMHHSIHTARWVDLIADSSWSLHMFPVDQADPDPNLRGVTLHWPSLPLAAGSEIHRARPVLAAPQEHPTARSYLARLARFSAFVLSNPGGSYSRLTRELVSNDFTLESMRKAFSEFLGVPALGEGELRLFDHLQAGPPRYEQRLSPSARGSHHAIAKIRAGLGGLKRNVKGADMMRTLLRKAGLAIRQART